MKNNTLLRTIILGCALLICFIANPLIANENPAKMDNEYLSIEKSLLPMFHDPYYISSDKFPFNRINPDIKEYLHFYLEKDNSAGRFSMNAISLLGYIGNNDDIQFVDDYLQEYLASSYRQRLLYKGNIAVGAGCFSGMMIKRKIEGAEAFFKKYAQVSIWYPPGEDDPEIISDARNAYSNFLIKAYDFSKEDYVLQSLQTKSTTGVPYRHELPFSWKESATGSTHRYESVVEMLMTRKTDLYTQSMEPVKISEDKLNEDLNKSLKEKAVVIEALVNKQTLAQWREAQEKQKAAPREEKKVADSHENIDLSNTVEGRFLKVVAGEAAKAYEQVSVELFDRDINDLPIKKEILQEIQKAGLNNYDGFQIMVEVEAKIDGFIPEFKNNQASAAVVKENETASVTFNIKGSADIVRKYIPDIGGNSLVSPTTGDVIINMKRSDDKWYWDTVSDPNISAPADIVEDKYLIDNVREAVIAYNQITKTLTDGNYDLLTIPVLDDGKIIPSKKREKDKKKMAEVLELEKRVLEDLEKAGLNNYTDYRIKVMYEAVLNNGGINIKGYETTDVTFMIIDGTKIFKKHAPREVDYDGPEGSKKLQVYMKRINGRWYWNPFGWYEIKKR
jgi:hypothetical protein